MNKVAAKIHFHVLYIYIFNLFGENAINKHFKIKILRKDPMQVKKEILESLRN
jgi:hypothetical protein